MNTANFTPEFLDKFFSLIEVLPSGCHRFGVSEGYGHIRINGRHTGAHRVAWQIAYGAIPPKQHVHHRCRNRWCVNPEHLESVSGKEHVRLDDTPAGRNAAKTRCPQGHPYNDGNTRLWSGHRYCRICAREKARARYRDPKNAFICANCAQAFSRGDYKEHLFCSCQCREDFKREKTVTDGSGKTG